MFSNYLRRIITVTDGYCIEVIVNLQKWWRICSCLSRILGREGSDPKISGHFCLVMVQAILLFGLEKWVMTPHMGRILGIFYHRLLRSISGIQTQIWLDGIWAYPPLEDSLQVAGMETMEAYISICQNMVAQCIETRPIIGLCM